MTTPLAGRTALVTGASRGIGRGIAERLAADGALVAVHYGRDAAAAAATVSAIEAAGAEAFAVGADLLAPGGFDALFDAVDRELVARRGGTGLDVLVNNAGILELGTIEEIDEATFDRQLGTNLRSVFFVVQRALPRLRDGGRIINVSSGTVRKALPPVIAYGAAKAGVDYLSLVLAAQLGPRGITVNSLSPGLVDTDRMGAQVLGDPAMRQAAAASTALGRVGQVQDIVEVAAFLASPAAGWITGQVIHANGGEYL